MALPSPLFLTADSALKPTAATLIGAVLAVCVMVVSLQILGLDPVAAIRDGALSRKPEAGLISDIGIFLMGLAAAFALVAGATTRRAPLLMLGAFCAAFAIDDALLLHERLGRYEVVLFALYGIGLLATERAFARAHRRHVIWPLAMALGAFFASAAIDVIWESLIVGMGATPDSRSFLAALGFIAEDIPKFAGIAVIASFAIGQSRTHQQIPHAHSQPR